MRRIILAIAAVMAVSGAGTFVTTGANAMTLNGSGPAAALKDKSAAQEVAYVCRRVWNGYRWVRRCYHTGPRYYYRPHYYRPYRSHRRYYRYY